ncbi:hypothetical protein CB0940_10976 [Cercospora beticola]|uniref:Uncharacterized protein n=1 Tax=Cercospora beticola TaxID=122368 RepID=A0A2G5HCR6_CERBT|nr:hypothetical protein CB0940_10976 [Cercospora beticola]PIA90356.1 hypothetical protein CB0940_10976 [Cercospora beticola]
MTRSATCIRTSLLQAIPDDFGTPRMLAGQVDQHRMKKEPSQHRQRSITSIAENNQFQDLTLQRSTIAARLFSLSAARRGLER